MRRRRQIENDAAAEARLRAAIAEGLTDFEAGRFEVATDLGAWFDALEAEINAARAVQDEP